MKKLSDLPIGAKIKDVNTKYNGHTLVWIIADKNHQGYPANTVTLISERILAKRKFDGRTARYKDSEIRKRINVNNGLLKDFSSDFKNAIASTTINIKYKDLFNDLITDKIFLLEMSEIEEISAHGGEKLELFMGDKNRTPRDFNNNNSSWWLRTPYDDGVSLDPSGYVDIIDPEGGHSSGYCTAINGVRPVCNIKSDVLVSSSTGSDGVYTITWNNPPIIETTTSTNMGLQNKEFEFTYKVSDEDNPTLTVNEYLDDKSTKQFTAPSGSTYTFSLSRLAYQKLLNGNHTIKIVANDNKGGVAEKVFNFSKNETKILFELQEPLQADAMVTKALINIIGSIPEKAILKIEACNNAYDANPTWEDVTDKVVENKKIFLSNKQKTASNWGFNIRVSVERNGAIGECYISSIGGNFE